MTFYLHPHSYTRPYRRVMRPWVENREHTLGINVHEQDEAYVLSALVPGLKAEDLNIQILDDVIRIDGEYKPDENEYLLNELPNGSFTRTLRLPPPLKRTRWKQRLPTAS